MWLKNPPKTLRGSPFLLLITVHRKWLSLVSYSQNQSCISTQVVKTHFYYRLFSLQLCYSFLKNEEKNMFSLTPTDWFLQESRNQQDGSLLLILLQTEGTNVYHAWREWRGARRMSEYFIHFFKHSFFLIFLCTRL